MAALRRIANEYHKLKASGPSQFSCGPVGDDPIQLSEEYPFEPPNVFFKTRIYHPNVNENGIIGLNLLGSGWTPTLSISKAVGAVNSLLTRPKLEEALDPEIVKIYREDRDAFNALAREWTRKHAM